MIGRLLNWSHPASGAADVIDADFGVQSSGGFATALGNGGKYYCPPGRASRVPCIDPASGAAELVDADYVKQSSVGVAIALGNGADFTVRGNML